MSSKKKARLWSEPGKNIVGSQGNLKGKRILMELSGMGLKEILENFP